LQILLTGNEDLLYFESTMAAPQSDVPSSHDPDDEDDTDAILAELEAEDTTSAVYQQRLNELQASSKGPTSMPATIAAQESYINLKSDDETLRFTTEHEKAIVHFRHADFARCAIMDDHLDKIAQVHGSAETSGDEIAFARVDVTMVPFVVEKLGVRVLPCVIGFAKGIVKGKVVGFEGICWDSREKDARVTRSLEETIVSWGLLKHKLLTDDHDSDSDDPSRENREAGRATGRKRGIRDAKQKVVDDADDWD
jgi:hypothetical protein